MADWNVAAEYSLESRIELSRYRLLEALILMSTPAGRLSLFKASIVLAVACMMSISRLWVRISNCWRAFLSMCGLDKHRIAFNPRRQGDRAVDDRAGPLGRIDDVRRTLVQHGVIVGLHPDADNLVSLSGHKGSPAAPNTDLPIPTPPG